MITINESVYREVAQTLKERVVYPYFSGTIKGEDWCLIASLIKYDNGDIVPIWYEFAINGNTSNDFIFDKVRELLKE